MDDSATSRRDDDRWKRPRWARPLTWGVFALIALQWFDVISLPTSWVAAAVALEVILVAVELVAFAIVLRHFFVRHRAEGDSRLDAYARASADELRTAGLPAPLAARIERAMLWEAGLYRTIGGVSLQLIRWSAKVRRK